MCRISIMESLQRGCVAALCSPRLSCRLIEWASARIRFSALDASIVIVPSKLIDSLQNEIVRFCCVADGEMLSVTNSLSHRAPDMYPQSAYISFTVNNIPRIGFGINNQSISFYWRSINIWWDFKRELASSECDAMSIQFDAWIC